MDLGKHEKEKPAEPEAPKAPTQEELLTEILAVLKEQQHGALFDLARLFLCAHG